MPGSAALAVAFGSVLLAGCGRSAPHAPPVPLGLAALRQSHAAVYTRAAERYRQAAFLSPDPQTTQGELRWMSPLIVQQFDPDHPEEPAWHRFGRLGVDVFGSLAVDTDERIVYHATSAQSLRGRRYEQSAYLWVYPPARPGDPIRWRGFRMLLGEHGYAVVWEILSSDADWRVFFVSQPVEEAARREFAAPLADRRYCVEPGMAEHPDVLVGRVVGDGPQPMGPFLYLDYHDLQVTTLICRCEPSQVDHFPTSLHYRLAEWSELKDAARDAPTRQAPLPDPDASSIHLLRLPERL